MIKTLKKFLNSSAMPFIVLFFAMLIINILKSTSVADDIWFAKCITGDIDKNITNIFSYFSWRYKNWSSRLIIEFFLINFAKNLSFLWKILDSRNFCTFSIFNI